MRLGVRESLPPHLLTDALDPSLTRVQKPDFLGKYRILAPQYLQKSLIFLEADFRNRVSSRNPVSEQQTFVRNRRELETGDAPYLYC